MRVTTVALAVAFVLCGGCSVKKDLGYDAFMSTACGDIGPGPPFADAGRMPLVCAGDCRDYVLDSIVMPRSAADARQYALVKGGRRYNRYGDLMATINTYLASPLAMDPPVAYGLSLVLLRVKAASLADAGGVGGQAWIGKPRPCCDPKSSPAACAATARKTCFGGQTPFEPAGDAPAPLVFQGSISGGRLALGEGIFVLRFATLPGPRIVDVPLVGAQLRGAIGADGITDGVLAGGVPAWAVKGRLVPMLADNLDRIYNGGTLDAEAWKAMDNLLDIDDDGVIGRCEVSNNKLLWDFLAGDVDLDGDGARELSLGFGFHAVRGVILAGQPGAADLGVTP